MKIAAVTRDGKIAHTIAESTEILIVTEENDSGSPSAYALIAPEALAAGSTDWTPVTMWQG